MMRGDEGISHEISRGKFRRNLEARSSQLKIPLETLTIFSEKETSASNVLGYCDKMRRFCTSVVENELISLPESTL